MLTVYHGSTCRVEQPLAGACRPNLDFGMEFYVKDKQPFFAITFKKQTHLWIEH